MEQTPPTNRLFVGNLSWGTDDSSLLAAFSSQEAQPQDAKVILDRQSGRSRGFGFVTFDSVEQATMARDRMNQQPLDGRQLRVDFANSQPAR